VLDATQVRIQESMGPRKLEVRSNQVGAPDIEAGKLSSRSGLEVRIESEQFPTLGNWVASLMSKQSGDRAATRGVPDLGNHQSFYQVRIIAKAICSILIYLLFGVR
jgi:hypothetical protein